MPSPHGTGRASQADWARVGAQHCPTRPLSQQVWDTQQWDLSSRGQSLPQPLRGTSYSGPYTTATHLGVLLARGPLFLPLVAGLSPPRRLLRGRPRLCGVLGLRLHLRLNDDDLEYGVEG